MREEGERCHLNLQSISPTLVKEKETKVVTWKSLLGTSLVKMLLSPFRR